MGTRGSFPEDKAAGT